MRINMPPFLPQKRFRSESPEAGPSKPPKSKGAAQTTPKNARKPTLFDDIDAGTGSKRTAGKGKALLEKLAADDDDESSLSSLSEDEFEDVPNAKRQKTEEPSEDEDEGMEFEDVHTNPLPQGPVPSGDLELTLRKDTRISLTNPFGTKKGPSKIERQIRISTHQIHVGSLMYHNAIRNSWLCNEELQSVLVKHLPPSIMERVEKWRQDSGLVSKSKKDVKGKGKAKVTNGKKQQKDWGGSAQRLEEGQVNTSSGDPIYGLMKRLVPFWKQRFRITAPGLRKLGYKSLQRLDEEMKDFYNEPHDIERHGELIRDLDDFKQCAKNMEGSRDVGAQLFTALLRGLGIEARMVASLQPIGYGWSNNEEAFEKEPRKLKKPKQVDDDSSDEDEASEQEAPKTKKGKAPAKSKKEVSKPKSKVKSKPSSPKGKGAKNTPIELSESDQDVSDDDSVVDITPAKQRILPSKPYDKDLFFPHYWSEVLSPVTHTYTPVDSIVLNLIATNPELVAKFEVRGKAEQAKQVTAYIVGHSSDGTAKDVTTRYLKNRMWPSKTKGNRIGIEKVPIYNRNGKVKRYEEYDWFKTVMSGYVRGSKLCPRTEIDDHEEATVLKPVKPEKKVVEEGKETLASYKASSEFVLERHLRREEALLPTAEHVKMFPIKGKGETSTEEKVYLRKDVVSCKSKETWHKEGRAPLPGEEALKFVPYRAATTNRKRELAEAEHASGGKVLQGLFSWDQTEWIVPPPIENGVIPKNSFGNIDLYVDSMLPEGAAHIPYRGTVKICKRLGIDYAEAVTGFEFGHRMAVPVITGVVVAEEHYESIMEEWEKDEVERVRKEDEKRQKAAVAMWRKMLMGLRIIKRIREEYGDEDGGEIDAINPWSRKVLDKDLDAQRKEMEQRDEDMAGGFLHEGHNEEEPAQSTFFPVAHEEDEEEYDGGGGFVVEGHDEPLKANIAQAYPTPQSFEFPKNSETTRLSAEEEEDEVQQPPKKRGPPSTAKSTRKSQIKMGDGETSEQEASEIEAPPPKKRGRPAASKPTKTTPSTTKGKTPAKKAQKAPAPRKAKSMLQIKDSEEEDEDNKSPSLSQSEFEAPVQSKRASTGKAKTPASSRQTSKRKVARKSTAATSPYFTNKKIDEDVDE